MKDFDVAAGSLIEHMYSSFEKHHPTLPKCFYVEKGRKYAKIISELGSSRSAYGFIVMQPTKNFQVGDILMAASWGAPATNFARGNIFEGNFERVTPWGVV